MGTEGFMGLMTSKWLVASKLALDDLFILLAIFVGAQHQLGIQWHGLQ